MAVVVTVVTCAVLISSLASAWREADRRFAAKREAVAAIAATLAAAVAPGLKLGSREDVARAVNSIARIRGIDYVRITDARGRIVHEFGTGIVVARDQGLVEANQDVGPLSAAYLPTYPVVAPITAGGIDIGRLVLIVDMSELRDALVESLAASMLAGLLAAMAALYVAERMQRSITRPIAALTTAMLEVAGTKNYARVVPRQSNDEIGSLVDTFNDMLGQIRSRDGALARNRDDLEIQVIERTRDLSAATLAAERANAAKSEFLATMSHEIRTPMNGMMVMAELIAAGELPPGLQRYARVLVSSGHSLLSIINDILDFSKIEAGKLDIEAVPVSPAVMVDDALKLFHERATSKGLELVAYVAPSVPVSIAADPVRLNQILTNLINNALKFTESGSVSVHVDAPVDGPAGTARLRIGVTDTGIGIPQAKIATIFEAFSQADQSTTRKFGGTGIGLTICHRLATAMHGAIHVTSAVGSGSTFTLDIPVAVLEPARPQASVGNGEPRRVVLAMPPSAARTVLARYLADAGHAVADFGIDEHADKAWSSVHAVIGPADAIAELGERDPRRFGKSRTISLVALSGLGRADAHNQVHAGAVDGLLLAPFATDEIAALMAAIARGREAFADLRNSVTAAAAPELPVTFAGVHVLAADDSAVNREVLIEALRRLRVEVTCVENGLAAVEAVKRGTFDLVFMDGSMPVMDGFEATRAIRDWEAETNRPAVPVVALTAHVVGSQSDLWRRAGMSDYVAKPYNLATLGGCLQRWIAPHKHRHPGHEEPRAQLPVVPASDQPAILASGMPATTGARAVLDRGVLDSIRAFQRAGDNLVQRVVGLFGQHAPKAAEGIRQAVASGQLDRVADAAHALKSLCRNIGADRLGDLCDKIETDARAGVSAAWTDDLAAVDAALAETLTALAADGPTAAAA